LLHADAEITKGDFKMALKSLQNIKKQNPHYISESLHSLAFCFEALQQEEKMIEYIIQLLEEYPHVPAVLLLSEHLQRWKGDKTASEFVADYVRRYPSIQGLHQFIHFYLSNAKGQARENC
jgi:lipopolysaccharide biosynthesis regulator YciM